MKYADLEPGWYGSVDFTFTFSSTSEEAARAKVYTMIGPFVSAEECMKAQPKDRPTYRANLVQEGRIVRSFPTGEDL